MNSKSNKKTAVKEVKSESLSVKNTNVISLIGTKTEYRTAMARIEALMAKGSNNVNKDELTEIHKLAQLAEAFEQKIYVIPPPTTFAGIIEMKMYELSLKQTDLAKKLHVSDTKLSMIMNGKQRPDILFLKAVHKELHVDANLLLEAMKLFKV